MNANTLRYKSDQQESDALLTEPDVQRVVEALEKREAEGPGGLRTPPAFHVSSTESQDGTRYLFIGR